MAWSVNTRRKIVARLALALTMLSPLAGHAVPSGISVATWIPSLDAQTLARTTYLTERPSTQAFLEVLTGTEQRAYRDHFLRALQALPSGPQADLAGLARLLISEGFDPNTILGPTSPADTQRRLEQAVCVRLTPERRDGPLNPILVTTQLASGELENLAAVWSLAKLMHSFRLQTVLPVWFCTTSQAAPGSQYEGVTKILDHMPKTGPADAHLAISGNRPEAYVNFSGYSVTEIRLTERRINWREFKGSHRMLGLTETLRTEIAKLKTRWDLDKTTPFLSKRLSLPVCQPFSVVHARKASCSFTVQATSRSRPALEDYTQNTVALASDTVTTLNREAKAQGFSKIRLELPHNIRIDPLAFDPTRDAAVRAWAAATHDNKLPGDYVSARFAESSAVMTADTTSSLALSLHVQGRPQEELDKRLSRLAHMVLILAGYRYENVTIAPMQR